MSQNKSVEEVVEEFAKMTDLDIIEGNTLYGKDSNQEWLKNNQDKHLFSTEVYGEPLADICPHRVAEWLTRILKQERQTSQEREREILQTICDMCDPNTPYHENIWRVAYSRLQTLTNPNKD